MSMLEVCLESVKELSVLFDECFKVNNEFNIIKNQTMNFIEDCLANNDIRNRDLTLFKSLISVKKKIYKEKQISAELIEWEFNSVLNTYCNAWNKKYEIRQKLSDKYVKVREMEVQRLKDNFEYNDFLLIRNKHLKQQFRKKYMGEATSINLSHKDENSLYKYADQMALKTVSFGIIGEIGLAKIINNQWEFIHPIKPKIVKIQGYLVNRIYKRLLFKNMDNFKGQFFVNNHVYEENGKLHFKVLVDNEEVNIFYNMEREILISNSSIIENILQRQHFTFSELQKRINESEIKGLINLGILTYQDANVGDTWNFLKFFDFIENPIFHKIEIIRLKLININLKFQLDEFEELETLVEELCSVLKISTFDLPVLTVDSYIIPTSAGLRHQKTELEKLSSIYTDLEKLSKFISLFDASKNVERAASRFLAEEYSGEVDFSKGEINFDKFLQKMANHIFNKINVGKLRSGFFQFEESPLLEKIISELMNSTTTEVILSKEFSKSILLSAKNDVCNDYHAYAFFLQPNAEGFVVNHVYKGYGVFNRRYQQNYANFNFEEKYGVGEILDMPYNFGFNANCRKINNALELGYVPSVDAINIKDWRKLKIRNDEIHQRIRFYDQNDHEIFPSYLGSLTPMLLPKSVAIINSVTLTGGLYFDLGDLLLRQKYLADSTKEEYYSPNIYFHSKSLLLSREKKLLKVSKIRTVIKSSATESDVYLQLKKQLHINDDFYIREFVLLSDFNKKPEKPLYITIKSPLSLGAMINYIKNKNWVVLESINPEFSYGSSHLTEYIVETTNSL
jgi:hypothetical protein